MRPIIAAIALALTSSPAFAQVSLGDIAITQFSTSTFYTVDTNGMNEVAHNAGNFGSGTSQSILWDRFGTSDFIIGGFGFIGRATITATGVNYSVLTNAIGTAAQMSFDPAGNIIVADAGADQIVSVDPTTGVVTPITTGAQPWGTSLNAGYYDPVSGDIFAGGNGSIWRVSAGVAITPAYATGWITAVNGFVGGITSDPGSPGDLIASLLTVNRVIRIDPQGNISDLVPPGTLTAPNTVTTDQNGDFIIAGSSGQVFRAPNPAFGPGGPPTALPSLSNGSTISYAAVVGELSLLTPPMTLAFTVNPGNSNTTVSISNIPPSATQGWTFVSFTTPTAAGNGPVFGITVDAVTLSIFNTYPVPQPGNFFHWTVGAPGVYPASPLMVPGAALTPFSTMTWDFVALAIGAGNITASNVVRITWP